MLADLNPRCASCLHTYPTACSFNRSRQPMAPRMLQSATVEGDPGAYEDQNVHAIYEEIASHFSSTRYKVNLPSKPPCFWCLNIYQDSHGQLSPIFSLVWQRVGLDWTPELGMGNICLFLWIAQATSGQLALTEAKTCLTSPEDPVALASSEKSWSEMFLIIPGALEFL